MGGMFGEGSLRATFDEEVLENDLQEVQAKVKQQKEDIKVLEK